VLLAVLLVPIVAVTLQTEPLEPVPHFAEREVSIIAHAGAQGHAPPNTLEAFEAALDLGADTLEMDLQVTADREIVTIHDGTVDRTTDGTGAVSELTVEQLQALDAGATWTDADGDTPFAGQGVRHATLREVLEAFPDTYLIIELKTDGGEAIIQPTIDLVREYEAEHRVTIASFREDYLVPVREQLPGVPTNMPESETYDFYVRHLVGLHPWWEPPGRLYQVPEDFDGRRVVTPRFVRAAERLGVDVQVWTVNDPEQMHRVLDAGAHAILTDYPDRVVEVLAEREATRGVVRGPDLSRYDGQLDRAASLQERAPWLVPVMAAVTFLGDEEFYLLLLPLLYWAVSRRFGIRLGAMLLLTASVNGLLKLIFTTPRPSFLQPEIGRVTETSFGVPSGHAQNAAAIWGLLAASVRAWGLRVALVALIALIGWSRFFLGVHFLEDLWVGWTVGIVLLALFLLLEGPVVRWWLGLTTPDRMLAAVVDVVRDRRAGHAARRPARRRVVPVARPARPDRRHRRQPRRHARRDPGRVRDRAGAAARTWRVRPSGPDRAADASGAGRAGGRGGALAGPRCGVPGWRGSLRAPAALRPVRAGRRLGRRHRSAAVRPCRAGGAGAARRRPARRCGGTSRAGDDGRAPLTVASRCGYVRGTRPRRPAGRCWGGQDDPDRRRRGGSGSERARRGGDART
jgi:glycerophosphoryl diester phosphodiesterase/membrane-associated phospholipid phosphatase